MHPFFFLLTEGSNILFFLIERMTEEVMRAEKRAYEKVIPHDSS